MVMFGRRVSAAMSSARTGTEAVVLPSVSRDTGSTKTSVRSTRAVASQITRPTVITLAFTSTNTLDILVTLIAKINITNMDENDEKPKMSQK